MLIELCLGYPQFLLRAIGHPVTWIGRLIGALDRVLNRDAMAAGARRAAGVCSVVILVAIVGVVAFFVQRELFHWPAGVLAAALLASTLIAQRSLHRHLADVAATLAKKDIDAVADPSLRMFTVARHVAEYPEADRLGQMLKVLGLDLAVTRGPKPALIATFDSPRGKVELRSDQM